MRKVLTYIAWGLMIVIAVVFALMAGNALALAVALLVVVVPVAGRIVVGRAARTLEVTLASPTTAQKSTPVECVLSIRNPSVIPLLRVQAQLHSRNMLTGQEHDETVALGVPARGEATYRFSLQSPLCGRMELSVAELECFEPTSVFSKRVPVTAQRRFSVMPDLHECYIREVLSAAPLSDTTMYSPYVKGNDASETFALREYEDGDDVRRIHWKLSEKTDELVVREASLPIDNSITVFWDKALYGTSPDPQRADALADLTLSVCQMLSEQGMQFEVVCNEAPSQQCIVQDVTSEEDIYELIGHLISVPLAQDLESAIQLYERARGPVQSSRIVYICCGVPAELLNLGSQTSVMQFVCDDTVSMESGMGYCSIHFAKDDVRGALTMAGAV